MLEDLEAELEKSSSLWQVSMSLQKPEATQSAKILKPAAPP